RPGIPASSVAIAALFALVALPRPAIPLIDGDVYWHIRAGLEILETGRVPTQDAWSIVGEGMRWLSQDWLSNVVMALGWRAGELGPSILSITWALLVVLALAILWWAYRLRAEGGAGWLGRITWLAAGLVVAGPVVGVRVQVVDLTLAATVVLFCWGYLASRSRGWLVPLPLIALAWANLHAGWPLMFLIGGAILVGEASDRILRRRPLASVLRWPDLMWLGGALALSAAAVAVNPNGLALYLYPLETSAIGAHRDFVAEWRPPDPTSIVGRLFIGFVIVVVLPALWAGRRTMRAADALLIIGFTAMMALGARFLLLAPIVAVAAGLALDPALSRTALGRAFSGPLARLATPRGRTRTIVNAFLVTLVLVAGVGITWTRISPGAQRNLVAQHMPVGAVDWIVANDPGTRPLNQYSWGGYLGLRRPETPVFIDGRSDIYGDAPIREYAEAVTLESDPADLLERHAIDYVLFPVAQPLATWLDENGWQRAYDDGFAGVWVRRE
ncbi:MAG: hypothetical protein ABR593_10195, partial [Candidatus Limnocylindria bacterium]